MRSTGWVTECGLKRLTESEAIKAQIATTRKSVSNWSRSALAVIHLVMWAAECFSDLSETLTVLQTRPSLCTPWNTWAGEFLRSQTNVSGSCRDWWIIGAPATDHLTWSISRQEISSNLEECSKLGHAVYIFIRRSVTSNKARRAPMVYIMSLCCTGLQANIKHNQCRAFLHRLQDTPQRDHSTYSSLCLWTCHALKSLLPSKNKWKLI